MNMIKYCRKMGNDMKRALVLAGGGSKGAYEVGFIKALDELNHEKFDMLQHPM